MAVELRILSADDWRLFREVRLAALREAPCAFSAKLSDWQGDGDVEERWRSRLVNVPLNVIGLLDGEPAGMIGASNVDDDRIALISM